MLANIPLLPAWMLKNICNAWMPSPTNQSSITFCSVQFTWQYMLLAKETPIWNETLTFQRTHAFGTLRACYGPKHANPQSGGALGCKFVASPELCLEQLPLAKVNSNRVSSLDSVIVAKSS